MHNQIDKVDFYEKIADEGTTSEELMEIVCSDDIEEETLDEVLEHKNATTRIKKVITNHKKYIPKKIIDSERDMNYLLDRKSNLSNNVLDIIADTDIDYSKGYKSAVFGNTANAPRCLFESQEIAEHMEKKGKNILSNIGVENEMTRNEKILLMFLLVSQNHDDKNMYNLTLNKELLSRVFGTQVSDYNRIIREAVNGLMSNRFMYFKGINGTQEPILNKSVNAFLDNGRDVQVQISNTLKEYFANFKRGYYTQIVMLDVVKLKKRSVPLYLFLKNKEGIINKKKKPGTEMYFSKDELMKAFKATQPKFANFKNEFLMKAKADINKNTNCEITIHVLTAKEKKTDPRYINDDTKEVVFTIQNKVIPNAITRLLNASSSIYGKKLKIEEGSFEICKIELDPVKEGHIAVLLKTKEGIEFPRTVSLNTITDQFRKTISEVNTETMEREKAEREAQAEANAKAAGIS